MARDEMTTRVSIGRMCARPSQSVPITHKRGKGLLGTNNRGTSASSQGTDSNSVGTSALPKASGKVPPCRARVSSRLRKVWGDSDLHLG